MNNIAQHKLSPNVSTDEHVRCAHISLGEMLSKKQAVYLDVNFWISLRKAEKGEGDNDAAELLKLLRDGVETARLFCPISESVFIELMKQNDLSTRLETAKLIDELSLGVTLVNLKQRIGTEIAYMFNKHTHQGELHPLEDLVWCKLSYVLGILHPTNTVFDAATETAIQKAFFDHMWTIRLQEMITIIGDRPMPGRDLSRVAAKLNAGVSKHAHSLRSFNQAYEAEAFGIADWVGSLGSEILESLTVKAGIQGRSSPQSRKKLTKMCKNLLAQSLVLKTGREVLRTMHILTSLHASLRWNKGRKFKDNDLFDFDHASAALAYCDAFFTERSLHTTVTQRHVALDKAYGCYVTSNVSDAISYLRNIN